MIKLIGIAVVALGFALRFNTLLVVMAAGIATGLCARMSFNDIMAQFGKFFVENRYMTLPVVLVLPIIGLLERHGLRERAATLIGRSRSATAGSVILLYTAVRQISISLGVNVGGHAGMVRPLVAPMAEAAAKLQCERATLAAEGAARARPGELPEKTVATIRAHAAAGENVGNFFGEDTVFAVGAVLLIHGVLKVQGYDVDLWALSWWGIPTALVAFGAMWWRMRVLDRRIAREVATAPGRNREPAP